MIYLRLRQDEIDRMGRNRHYSAVFVNPLGTDVVFFSVVICSIIKLNHVLISYKHLSRNIHQITVYLNNTCTEVLNSSDYQKHVKL